MLLRKQGLDALDLKLSYLKCHYRCQKQLYRLAPLKNQIRFLKLDRYLSIYAWSKYNKDKFSSVGTLKDICHEQLCSQGLQYSKFLKLYIKSKLSQLEGKFSERLPCAILTFDAPKHVANTLKNLWCLVWDSLYEQSKGGFQWKASDIVKTEMSLNINSHTFSSHCHRLPATVFT